MSRKRGWECGCQELFENTEMEGLTNNDPVVVQGPVRGCWLSRALRPSL